MAPFFYWLEPSQFFSHTRGSSFIARSYLLVDKRYELISNRALLSIIHSVQFFFLKNETSYFVDERCAPIFERFLTFMLLICFRGPGRAATPPVRISQTKSWKDPYKNKFCCTFCNRNLWHSYLRTSWNARQEYFGRRGTPSPPLAP